MYYVEDEKDLEIVILAKKKPQQSTIKAYVVHRLALLDRRGSVCEEIN